MSLPAVAPDVVAEAVTALPNRLRSKLDQAVEKQPGWTITTSADAVTVAIDDQVTVTLTTPVDAAERAVCTCLLAPRCLHRAAVLSAAPVLAPPGDPKPAETGPDRLVPQIKPDDDRSESVDHPPAVDADVIAAAELVRDVAARLLERGVSGAGAVTQADLLRAVHQARTVGLPRLASAGVRVVEQVRAARRGDPGFRLANLADDLREVFTVCHLLVSGNGDQHAALGTSRRGYHPVGELRLYGLCTEPLRTATGHVGVVSYLTDDEATIWTLAQVRPGDPAAARNPGNTSVSLGEITISHRELSRAGIIAVNAHASVDRRLSQGRAVQAVRTPGRGWYDHPAAALWRRPVAEQAARWLTTLDQPPYERPAGHDFVFLDGVLNTDRRGLLLEVAQLPAPVVVLAPHDDPSLPFVTNLRLLAAHAVGRSVRMIGRFRGPRQVYGLALAANWLPDRFGGHVDLGIDQLQRGDLPSSAPARTLATSPASATLPVFAADPQPPLHLLTHHLQRVVAAGRGALVPSVDRDFRVLVEAQLPAAAALLRQLRHAGQHRSRDTFGRLDRQDSSVLAAAWLSGAVYQHAANSALIAEAWQLCEPKAE